MGKREGFNSPDGWRDFTSAKLTTENKGDWGPGHYIEVRAKLPTGVGTWPAIWMMPTDDAYGTWPNSGEIDIMEAAGQWPHKVFGTIHTECCNHMTGTDKGKTTYMDLDEWHTYALRWESNKLVWFYDGKHLNTYAPDNVHDPKQWPFNKRFYLILNLAIGGSLGGDVHFHSDQIVEFDYVRIYNLEGSVCCSGCSGRAYCSPQSYKCYDNQNKDYYEDCQHTLPACCGGCSGRAYCSPESYSCYDHKNKNYYESCSNLLRAREVGNQTAAEANMP